MKNKDPYVQATLAFLLTLATTHTALGATQASMTNTTEKCYGIVKAGFNDCATNTASCAGSATQDRQPDAFIFLPKGTCSKIVGGSLTPIKTTEKES